MNHYFFGDNHGDSLVPRVDDLIPRLQCTSFGLCMSWPSSHAMAIGDTGRGLGFFFRLKILFISKMNGGQCFFNNFWIFFCSPSVLWHLWTIHNYPTSTKFGNSLSVHLTRRYALPCGGKRFGISSAGARISFLMKHMEKHKEPNWHFFVGNLSISTIP